MLDKAIEKRERLAEAAHPAPPPLGAPSAFTVAMIQKGAPDQSGQTIEDVYAIRSPLYATYKAGGDVMVQYVDDPATQVAQRTRTRAVSKQRQDLDALADGWKTGARYHRALGLALVDALDSSTS